MQCKRVCGTFLTIIYIGGFLISCKVLLQQKEKKTKKQVRTEVLYNRTHPDCDRNLPLIFIGGVPRSGTTLMRTMLDAHRDIRCGPETHVIPSLLLTRDEWLKYESHNKRLELAGVEPVALDIGIANFMLEIIKFHGAPTLYYCNKDPLLLLHMDYVKKIFPNSKFILMVRDGRASAHSIISKKVKITNVDTRTYRSTLKYWNREIEKMHRQCLDLGENECLHVYYEQLVLRPLNTTREIFKFLDIDWRADILHHEKHVNKAGISKFELSTDQVQRPLYIDALTSWFGKIPKDVEMNMEKIAPMLATLGYDPSNPRPTYGEPDDFVLGKTNY